MRKLMMLVAFVASGSCALADGKDSAIKHIAQVTAIQHLCPAVEPNMGMIALIATTYGVDFERDGDVLRAEISRQEAPWKGQPAENVCVAGLMLYGPEGSNVPGLIRPKN